MVKVMASGGMGTPGTDPAAAQFSLEELRLVVEEAHAAGLPVAAHAHAASAVRLALRSASTASSTPPTSSRAPTFPRASPGSSDLAEDDLARLVESQVAVCPTIGGSTSSCCVRHPHRCAPGPGVRLHPETIVAQRRAMVGRMADAGVRLVSGADAGIAPGKGHGRYAEAIIELGLLAPTEQALASATSVAADVCRLGDRTGKLRAGYDADLAVVDGDLADDLTGLRRVTAVVLRGQPLT